jgi:putative Holliday junction resolvase
VCGCSDKKIILFCTFAKWEADMGRIIGIDYGRKRVGVSVTDTLQIFASPLKTVASREFDDFINEYSKKEQVEAFVVGYPVQMNNKPSESVKYIDPFIRKLKRRFPEKPVHLVDERFTSRIAFRSMIDGGVKKEKRQDKSMVDKISASLILQSFLDNRSVGNKIKKKE